MKAFTLLEVLIAVIILFISASVFLEVVSNTRNLTNIYISSKEKILKSSIVLENKDAKNAYEMLIDFHIDNDQIIHDLKNDSVSKKIEKYKNYEIIEINGIKYFRFY